MEMKTYIGNERIRVGINHLGAELISLVTVSDNREYMWKGDPAFWGKHSPVLFPIVGKLRDNAFLYQGKQYSLSRHGFARDMTFNLDSAADTRVIFSVESTPETLRRYPFPFRLLIQYTVREATLEVIYEVVNIGADTMYFSLGAHPAFAVPVVDGENYDDYSLHFNQVETLYSWPIDKAGLIERTPVPFLDHTDRLALRKELFYKDAIVLKSLKSNVISIKHKSDPHGLDLAFEQFPFLGLWAAKDANFLCIEPWCGIADSVDHNQDITTKEGIEKLPAGSVWKRTWSVTVY